ncbi:MAG: hypothetical protein HWD58_21605 [Bacteroidota bacterium]|nr:MAG: hypothetical protein HWD58_21605 [Bacteroidota bacterium]
MKFSKLFITSFVMFSILSCHQNSNFIQSTYLSCYIDGKYFEPDKGGGLGEYPLTAKLQSNETLLTIRASREVQNVILAVYDTTGVKVLTYQFTNTPYTPQAIYDNNLSVDNYKTDSTNTGIVNIVKIDKENLEVEGTFSFTAYNSVINDTIHVTNGKFKLNYTIH